jgi:hypothetical protein
MDALKPRVGGAVLLLALLGCGPGEDPARPWPLRAYCAARDWVEREDFRVRDEQTGPDPCQALPDPRRLLEPPEREPQDDASESDAG